MLCLTLPVIQRNLRMVEINKYYYYYYYYYKFIFNFFNLLTVTEKKYIITGSRKRAKPLTDENTATPLTPITINVTVPSFFFFFLISTQTIYLNSGKYRCGIKFYGNGNNVRCIPNKNTRRVKCP